MVLESLINPENAENHSWLMIFLGFLYSSVAMLLAYWIFKSYSSIVMIFFVTMASIPIIYRVIKMEEEKDLTDMNERLLLKEHGKALSSFMYLFLGATLAFVFWYVVLPVETLSILFESQANTLSLINPTFSTGYATQIAGNVSAEFELFKQIFLNNIKVLVFCILFSFLYGAGAIFILMWNASVIGVAIGNFIRTNIAALALELGGVTIGGYFSVVSIGLLKYTIHGIPEILAYFFAALAGGIISIAIINHEYSSRKFEHILLDAADLLLLSIAIIFIAALLEVYVTPVVFG